MSNGTPLPNAGKDFVFAGNAMFTVVNTEKQSQQTFLVRSPKKRPGGKVPPPDLRFVFAKSAHAGGSWEYLGTARGNPGQRFFTPKNSVPTPQGTVFEWLIGKVWQAPQPHAGVVVLHAGRCGRCYRRLTDADSIAFGIGPECRKNLSEAVHA